MLQTEEEDQKLATANAIHGAIYSYLSPLFVFSFFLFFSRSKYQSQKLPVILRESLDKRGKLERWMRVSWQIHDVNTFVSPSKWAAVSSLPNKCQPNKTSWLHTNAITGRIPGEEKRQRGPTGRKTHCLSTARPVCTISRTYDSTLHEINYPLFFPSNHRLDSQQRLFRQTTNPLTMKLNLAKLNSLCYTV